MQLLLNLVLAVFLLGVMVPTRALAFEQLPRSLAWELLDISGAKQYNPSTPYGTYRVQPGEEVDVWIKVKNLSKNPRAEVWYGVDDLLPEPDPFHNAHAIGVGVINDAQPKWIDPSSFVINNNRFTYYNGSPVFWGQVMTVGWKIKIASNTPAGIYTLHLGLVREFDEWGQRVTGTGALHPYQDFVFQFAVGNAQFSTGPADEYFTQSVATPRGTFSTYQMKIGLTNPYLKVATDTATSSATAPAPWPVLSLRDFATRNAANIGVNGAYFWPTEYGGDPLDANTFESFVYNTRLGVSINDYRSGALLAFDEQNKPYFFLTKRDFESKSWFEATYKTKLRAAIANVPALVYNGQINYGDGTLDDKMLNTKASRVAVGFTGADARIVVASNATVPDLAAIVQSLGLQYALNLDGGGSTALYYNGVYKLGPGRNLASALLFQTK